MREKIGEKCAIKREDMEREEQRSWRQRRKKGRERQAERDALRERKREEDKGMKWEREGDERGTTNFFLLCKREKRGGQGLEIEVKTREIGRGRDKEIISIYIYYLFIFIWFLNSFLNDFDLRKNSKILDSQDYFIKNLVILDHINHASINILL